MKLEEIKEGDYLYYTERPYSNYADGLELVYRDNEGILKTKVICVNWDGNYTTEDCFPYDWGEDLPISSYDVDFNEKSWHKTDYDPSLDPVVYMNNNFPLSGE